MLDPDALPPWLWMTGKLLLAAAVGVAVQWALFRVLERLARKTERTLDERILAELRPGARLILPLLAIQAVMPTVSALPPATLELIRHSLVLVTIAALAWLAVGAVGSVAALARSTHRLDVADNLEARRVHTQMDVLERTIEVGIVVVAAGAALMTFPRVRDLGAGVLASAGVVGLAVGLAARPVLENLIAGLQLALTQPIRIDDVVIVEGEWGRVEEFTSTYVVVRVWDERRLIVPFSKFIQEPFQNWTRRSADILGTVHVYADYTVPVNDVRRALEEIVHAAPEWDGRVCNLQVTGTSERGVELRALVSAADSSRAWDLRVHVREQLLDFLQRAHPECLPRTRVALQNSDGNETPGAPAPSGVPPPT